MYDARVIAKYIIGYYANIDWSISNLKLQKVLYFLQAQYLVTHDKKLFDDEIEAWGMGPVVPSVYREYSMFGGASIPCFNKEMPVIRGDDAALIDDMLEKLKDLSSAYLTQIVIHQKPWMQNFSEFCTRIIPAEEIRDYFMEG